MNDGAIKEKLVSEMRRLAVRYFEVWIDTMDRAAYEKATILGAISNSEFRSTSEFQEMANMAEQSLTKKEKDND
jgi:hypothetical protein